MISDLIIHTVAAFLDTHEEMAGREILIDGEPTTGESEDVRMLRLTVDGVLYLVVAKKGG